MICSSHKHDSPNITARCDGNCPFCGGTCEQCRVEQEMIEVLEDLQYWMVHYPHLYSPATEKWWNLRAKPLLDKLQALKKEGTDG